MGLKSFGCFLFFRNMNLVYVNVFPIYLSSILFFVSLSKELILTNAPWKFYRRLAQFFKSIIKKHIFFLKTETEYKSIKFLKVILIIYKI